MVTKLGAIDFYRHLEKTDPDYAERYLKHLKWYFKESYNKIMEDNKKDGNRV